MLCFNKESSPFERNFKHVLLNKVIKDSAIKNYISLSFGDCDSVQMKLNHFITKAVRFPLKLFDFILFKFSVKNVL